MTLRLLIYLDRFGFTRQTNGHVVILGLMMKLTYEKRFYQQSNVITPLAIRVMRRNW